MSYKKGRRSTQAHARVHAGVHTLPHTISGQDQVLDAFETSVHGLSREEAAARLERYGRNTLPRKRPPGLVALFLRQFLSPLIYVLLMASVVSLFLHELSDAAFIVVVLLINAAIGTAQEYSAERSAEALQELVKASALVIREGDSFEVDSQVLVPGDMVLLEEGAKVPADVRLISTLGLEVDEALLTGESLPVGKDREAVLDPETPLGDRVNMAYAGTMVARGRGTGVVVATGLSTEIGGLAATLLVEDARPPLLVRMERFTFKVALSVAFSVVLIFGIQLSRGVALGEVFLQSVALAVSAIPEGLPVALTVALAIGTARMAKRNVIVRRLVSVETLGSCSFIASDKTGTLTMNELTVVQVALPGMEAWRVTGGGTVPDGEIVAASGGSEVVKSELLERLALASVLCNEAFLGRRDNVWVHHGDMVDVALLVMGHKAGVTQADAIASSPQLDLIPFESKRQFAASLNMAGNRPLAHVKGAPERVFEMCRFMVTPEGDLPLDLATVERQAEDMANSGYRILALASGEVAVAPGSSIAEEHLEGLTFLGLVGMIDPLRPEARGAVAACRDAGVQVAMVTGDHPLTSLAIARELMMAQTMDQVVTGPELKVAEEIGQAEVDAITANARVFARVEPRQKLQIVQSIIRHGHTVAVTGDGANDAPALRAAHVGVAMGRGGTDVARESADIILSDDNFASIVAGIDEGRISYANVRKVIYLLISTGAAEIVLFALALLMDMPLPLVAVQLLWLNLVTNGIQDVALAFEPAEGDEMKKRPRPPEEPVFDRLMVERVIVSALVIGGVAFGLYRWFLSSGWTLEEARNSTVLLMVLFENVQAFNSRSELRSVFADDPRRNYLLLFGTVAAQLVHVGAMYVPWMGAVLGIGPVSAGHWIQLLGLALILLAVTEVHKFLLRRRYLVPDYGPARVG